MIPPSNQHHGRTLRPTLTPRDSRGAIETKQSPHTPVRLHAYLNHPSSPSSPLCLLDCSCDAPSTPFRLRGELGTQPCHLRITSVLEP